MRGGGDERKREREKNRERRREEIIGKHFVYRFTFILCPTHYNLTCTYIYYSKTPTLHNELTKVYTNSEDIHSVIHPFRHTSILSYTHSVICPFCHTHILYTGIRS